MPGKKGIDDTSVAVPILCRFWFEDGVWNGSCEDLAVAAFGASFEQAMSNVRTAIGSHLESIIEAGEAEDVIARLQERAKEYGFLSLDQLSPASPLVKMVVAIKNRELVAIT